MELFAALLAPILPDNENVNNHAPVTILLILTLSNFVMGDVRYYTGAMSRMFCLADMLGNFWSWYQM